MGLISSLVQSLFGIVTLCSLPQHTREHSFVIFSQWQLWSCFQVAPKFDNYTMKATSCNIRCFLNLILTIHRFDKKKIYPNKAYQIRKLIHQFNLQQGFTPGNRPFSRSLLPVLKRVFLQNHSCENRFGLQVHFHADQTCFHIKGVVPRLVLKHRQKASQKWTFF